MADLHPEDDDDVEDVFVLGGSGAADDDRERRRGSKRCALCALAIVVVVVAVAITLVSLLVDTSGPPATPSAAAQRWANDLVDGDDTGASQLECADAASSQVLSLILTAPTGAQAGAARKVGARRWVVPVAFDQVGQSSPLHANLTVVQRDGAYLVC